MAILNDVKGILSINLKTRHDSYADQFTRVFMMKLMILAAFFIGMNWYNDKINCITSISNTVDGGFLASACWIHGLYVYEEIGVPQGQLGYYGIPTELDHIGINRAGKTCKPFSNLGSYGPGLPACTSENIGKDCCTPMKKTFYLQYQYLVFLIAVLAGLYYVPYVFFKMINTDLISLQNNYTESTAEGILASYYNRKLNPVKKQRLRVLGTLLVKVLYIVVNVAAFLALDSILYGKYRTFGSNWISWSKLDNHIQYDHMGLRNTPKPANQLLPSFAICEISELAADSLKQAENRHKYVCELNNFVLYQYIFLITWFAQIAGIIISVIGLLIQVFDHLLTITCFMHQGSPEAKAVLKRLTFREFEYLEFVRKKNMELYNELHGLVAMAVGAQKHKPDELLLNDFNHKH